MKTIRPKITAVIIARNSAATMTACVRALGFCTDIIVGVNDSTDATAALARRAGARVLPVKWEGYARTKNRLIGKVRDGWVLSVDADEVVDPVLARALHAAAADPGAVAGYWISRRNFFLGRWIRHGGWSPDWQLRFFRAGGGAFSERLVHEALEVSGATGRLPGAVDHYTYANVQDYLQRFNRYTSLAARDRHARGRRFSWLRLCLDPFWTFFKMYGIKSAWRDGFQGLALSLLSSLNTLVKHAKHWELEKSAPKAP